MKGRGRRKEGGLAERGKGRREIRGGKGRSAERRKGISHGWRGGGEDGKEAGKCWEGKRRAK